MFGRKIAITRFAEFFLNFAKVFDCGNHQAFDCGNHQAFDCGNHQAFDCGNHQILPKPLEHCGVRGKAHDFMIY